MNLNMIPRFQSPLERIVLTVTLLLLISATGLFIRALSKSSHGIPILIVELGESYPVDADTEIPLVVSNLGKKAATAIQISVIAWESENEHESTCIVDSVPAGEKRKALVRFPGLRTISKPFSRVVNFK